MSIPACVFQNLPWTKHGAAGASRRGTSAASELQALLGPDSSPTAARAVVEALRRSKDKKVDYWRLMTILQCAQLVAWDTIYTSDSEGESAAKAHESACCATPVVKLQKASPIDLCFRVVCWTPLTRPRPPSLVSFPPILHSRTDAANLYNYIYQYMNSFEQHMRGREALVMRIRVFLAESKAALDNSSGHGNE